MFVQIGIGQFIPGDLMDGVWIPPQLWVYSVDDFRSGDMYSLQTLLKFAGLWRYVLFYCAAHNGVGMLQRAYYLS